MEQSDIIEVEPDEIDDVIETMGYSLVAFVVSGCSGFEAVNKLTNSWKVHDTFKVHKSDWLVFRYDSEKDRQKVLTKGPYLIFIRAIVKKPMTTLFNFGSASMSTLPVWINVLGLPCDIWNANVLANICSKVGTPLYTDAMTGNKHRISFARVLVDVDLAKDWVTEVTIKLPNGVLRKQAIIFENVPKFCSSWKVLCHSTESCKRKLDNQAVKSQQQTGNQPHLQHQSKDSSNTVGQQGLFKHSWAAKRAFSLRGDLSGQNQLQQADITVLNQKQISGQQLGQLGGVFGAEGELEFGLNQPAVSALIQGQISHVTGLNQLQFDAEFADSVRGKEGKMQGLSKQPVMQAVEQDFLGAGGIIPAFRAVYLLQRTGLILAQKSQENSGMMQGVPGLQQASLMQAVSGTIAAKTGQYQSVLPALATQTVRYQYS
ncbi:hypothetical protein M9H77_29669 [Catharanthus roseus]|uniref:Uncharacterized protein n=1 Tax=Catharanthus roseus TaxID=4058 RepID=A0ACB9ZV26_CATRO|nr:hypothetical protein M9H77_29669 [Catharanthus roseus]